MMGAQDSLHLRELDPTTVTVFKLLQKLWRHDSQAQTLTKLVRLMAEAERDGLARMIAGVD